MLEALAIALDIPGVGAFRWNHLVLDVNGKPVKPKRSDKVFYMMFPAKYINTIRACIETVHGVKEPKK